MFGFLNFTHFYSAICQNHAMDFIHNFWWFLNVLNTNCSSLVGVRPCLNFEIQKLMVKNEGDESPKTISNLDFYYSFSFQMEKFENRLNFVFIYNLKHAKVLDLKDAWFVKTRLFDRLIWNLQSIHMKELPKQSQNICEKSNSLATIPETFESIFVYNYYLYIYNFSNYSAYKNIQIKL